jgi:hypothetical protein
VKLHEVRHSAADDLWRKTGNLNESPATTAAYLHPTREDLEAALRSLDVKTQECGLELSNAR